MTEAEWNILIKECVEQFEAQDNYYKELSDDRYDIYYYSFGAPHGE